MCGTFVRGGATEITASRSVQDVECGDTYVPAQRTPAPLRHICRWCLCLQKWSLYWLRAPVTSAGGSAVGDARGWRTYSLIVYCVCMHPIRDLQVSSADLYL